MDKQQHASSTKKSTLSRLPAHLGLWIVLLFFVWLSTIYSVIVPITQGEDELAHYRYISFIAQTGRLPINYTEREQAWYRADWPPLYHLLVGWAISPLDTRRPHLKDVGESPRRRLVGEIFYPRLIIYTEDANWPWQDGILAWHIGRFISILLSATALIFSYCTSLELCKAATKGIKVQKSQASLTEMEIKAPRPFCTKPHLFATATTALLAFTPRYLFTSAMLGDDSLFILLSAIFIWLLLRALHGDDRWRVYVWLGILLGLSITTKYSAGLFPLIIIPLVWWRARQTQWHWLQPVRRLILTWLFVLLSSSWWFGWLGYYFNSIKEDGLILGLLNSVLATGPDVSMRRVFAFFGGNAFTGPIRPGAVAEGNFGQWLIYLFQTFWSVPILEQDLFFPWAYLLILFLCVLSMAGLWQIWRSAAPETRITPSILALIVGLLIPFPILRYFLTFNILETGQGRHILYPAAQSIPILLMIGWFVFFRSFQESKIHFGLLKRLSYTTVYASLIPLPLFIWSIFQLNYMRIAYPNPLPVQTTTFKTTSIPQPLKHNFSDAIQFLGYDFQPDPEQAIINLTLYWKSLEAVDENYRTQIQLVDPDGHPHFTWLSHPLNGLYPTRAWDKGDIIRDTLPLPLAAVPANTYNIQINLLHEAEDLPINSEPFQIIQMPLIKTQPIANASTLDHNIEYRLWLADNPVRYRQTLPLSWKIQNPQSKIKNPAWALVGPDAIPRKPIATGDATAIFMVEAAWPGGDYRLALINENIQTDPLFTIANEARAFNLPTLASEAGYIPVEANFANQIKLLGYTLPTRRVEPGGGIPLNVVWQSLAPVLPDAITFAVLLDANQQSYGNIDRYPSGFYSPILWAKDEIIEDSFTVPVQPDAPPGVYYLHVGQYQLVNNQPESLPLFHEGSPTDNTAVVIGPFKVDGPPPGITIQNPTPQINLNQSLGDQITLLGYDLTDLHNQPIQNPSDFMSQKSQNLKLTLYWQANTDIYTDYTTFFHLRNDANETVAQKDSPPAAGSYPTSLWNTNEIIVDEITLSLEQLSPGAYTPVVGLYNRANDTRLSVPNVPANEITLQPFLLKE